MFYDAKVLIGASPFLPKLLKLKKMIFEPICGLSAEYAVTTEPVPFGDLNGVKFLPIKKGDKWGGFFDCGWFRFRGNVPIDCTDKHLIAIIDTGGEGCVFDADGTPIIGLTANAGTNDFIQPIGGKLSVEISSCSEGGERIDLLVETGNNGIGGRSTGRAALKRAEICAVNDALKDFYYDFVTLFILHTSLRYYDARRTELKKALNTAYDTVIAGGADAVKTAKGILEAELNKDSDTKRFTLYATGHAHLDLAWLWPLRESKRKAARTYSTALQNLDKYDGYIFGSSQPQQYEWIKENHPALFEKIKAAVANGRIEPQGGMWVESDTNLPCGESLIRQVYYGKKFFKEEFGQDMKILWLPDVFGFSAQLPQIIKKTGMDYFLTIKLSWNEHTKFPAQSFIWEGLDESRVLSHMPPEGTYNSSASPIALAKALQRYSDKDRAPIAHIPYGVGDGGGGPGEAHLEYLKRLTRDGGVKGLPLVKNAKAEEFFEDLSQYQKDLKVFKGELYLEKHQGTLTTQAKNKYYNRRSEVLLHNVEFLAAVAGSYGYEVPSERIDKIWKEILLYQFHDIIPGSSISRVYKETTERYEIIVSELNALQNEIISYISQKTSDTAQAAVTQSAAEHEAETQSADGEAAQAAVNDGALYAVNASPFIRDEYIKHNNNWYKAEIMPYAAAQLKDAGAESLKTLNFTKDGISNSKLEVVFAQAGYIKSLKDKATGYEFAGKLLNRLVAYGDRKKVYNAWDIDIRYPNNIQGYFEVKSVDTYIDGASVVRETLYKYGKSYLRQKAILKYGAEYLLFETEVDWRETHKMLRADFYPSCYSDKAVFDIQFGNIERSTGTKTLKEYAQFEVCAHKWADVTDAKKGYGISVLNDCKYGHRVKDGLISLNLLRSTTYPDKKADKGRQVFTYALYPHEGGVFDGSTVQLGYFINNPLLVTDNALKIDTSVLTGKKNIITETIKPSGDGRGTVLRMYENSGIETVTSVKTNLAYAKAYECDMIEDVYIGEADLNALHFKPYEIKTVILTKK
ncbi:MAG: glycosyl hydrolase-related protein [Clostridiales bacterium]|jgi:alpha-mannosidase|nr:glycosyl hydrolase-related protein [Clostridiales bacterium]